LRSGSCRHPVGVVACLWVLLHADSKVEEDKWEMTDDGRMSLSEGMKRATTVWKWDIWTIVSGEDLNRDNVLNRFEDLNQMNFNCWWFNWDWIDWITFHEIDISRLEKSEQSIVERILSSTKLFIKSENSLYETIWQFIANDRTNLTLIQFVWFEFVSKSITTRFISNGSDFVELIDSSIWMSFVRRFIEGFPNDQSNCRFLRKGRHFVRVGNHMIG
jgi:hypothetical protein